MEATENVLRGLLAITSDGLVAVDAVGIIVFANPQAERLFGWEADELIGREVEVLVPSSARDWHVGERDAYVADPHPGPMGAGRRLLAQRKDGTSFAAEISLSTITDDLGNALVLTAVRGVTDRVEVRAERRHREPESQPGQSHRLESLSDFAGGVAHDFNNPLGVILSYVALLDRNVTDPQAVADLGEIKAAAEQAVSLTRRLLEFARPEVAQPELLQVNDIVRSSATLLEPTVGEHIELRLELDPGVGLVFADRQQLERVLLNLVLNGGDAMPAGGVLRVITEGVQARDSGLHPGSADDVVLRVVDTGTGMPAEVLGRAFEPFFTTKSRGEGRGLGLATVYGIVRQSDGEVTITSHPGQGTTVSVRLPGIESLAIREVLDG